MNGYDRYGFLDTDAAAILNRLETALGIKFLESESSYVGVHWTAPGITEDEKFELQSNFLDDELDWTDPQQRDCLFLLEISGTGRADDLEAQLRGAFGDRVRLIRREAI